MSSQFNRSYHVTSNSVLSAELWNSVFQNIDQRLIGVEEKKASFEQAEQQLLEVGLRRINETLTPAAEKIMALSEMGFLVASSEELIKPMDGQTLSVHLIKGAQSDLFQPSPFVALVRRSTPDAYAIGKLLHYDRDLARVDMNIVAVRGDMGPHDDWDVAALAGSVKAMWDALQESRAIRDDVQTKHGDIAQKSADVTAKHGEIITKHGDFVSTWYGALTAPPEGAKTGAMYLDIGQNPAVVMVKSNDGWIIAAIASYNVYTKAQADNKFYSKNQADTKFLTQDNAQFLPLFGGTVTGELTVKSGVDATSAFRVQGDTILAYYFPDGNINGSVWNNWGSYYANVAISNRIEARAIFHGRSRFHVIEILTSGEIDWPDWVEEDTPVHVMAWGGGGECVVGWFKRSDFINSDVIIGAGGHGGMGSRDGGIPMSERLWWHMAARAAAMIIAAVVVVA